MNARLTEAEDKKALPVSAFENQREGCEPISRRSRSAPRFRRRLATELGPVAGQVCVAAMMMFAVFAGRGQDNIPSNCVAIVVSCVGSDDGLRLVRDSKSGPVRIGCKLLDGDEISLGRSNAVSMVKRDATIEAVRGPKKWKIASRSDTGNNDLPFLERLLQWFSHRDRIIARGAGSRGMPPDEAARLNLICAAIDEEKLAGKQSPASGRTNFVVWAGRAATQSRLELVFWRGKAQLKALPLAGEELKNYGGPANVRLFKAAFPLNPDEGVGITHLSLFDPVARLHRESVRVAWTNVWQPARGSLYGVGKAAEHPDNGDLGVQLARAVVLEAQGRGVLALDVYLAVLAAVPESRTVDEALATFFDGHGCRTLADWHKSAATSK